MMKEQIQTLFKQYFSTKDIRRTYSLLKPFIIKQWKAYLALFLLMGVNIYLTIAFAKFYGQLTDAAIHGSFRQLLGFIPYGIFLILINITSNVSHIYFDTIATTGVKKDLQNHLFHHILRLPAKDTANFRSGELIAHFSNDIHGVDGVIGSSLVNLVQMPIAYLVVFIYLLHINLTLCFASIAIAPLVGLAGLVFGIYLKKSGRRIHQLVGEIQSHLSETFHGLTVIRSFTMEKIMYNKYAKKNQELYQMELGNAKLRSWYYSGGHIISSVTFIVSLTIGAIFVSRHLLTVGALFTFVNLVNYLVFPLTGMAGQWAGFQRSAAGLERVLDVLERKADLKELPTFSPALKPLKTAIEFKNICFHYENSKNIFDQFQLQIPAGKVVALVGPSGAGKSTLFNLLQGFYQPQAGEIFIDGVPIQNYRRSELRSAIAHVPQETFLFAGTIRENLLMARPGISEKEMMEAAVSADIHEFIHSLPKGYETEIGERGIKLSGGQKQRIAIARAILKDAPILLLDEATSALDSETEYHVKEALDKLMAGRTTIVIAHRLSTIQNADVIIVMDEGKIVQIGNHDGLLSQQGLYRNLSEKTFKTTGQRNLSLVSRP